MNNWQIIQTFTYPHEAHMVKNYLESEGIHVLIQDELTAQVNNFYSNAIGGVKLLVPAEEHELGLQLLQKGDYLPSESKAQEVELEIVPFTKDTDRTLCPFCHSENIGKRSEPNVLTLVVFFILGAIIPFFRSAYVCYDCDKVWKFRKGKSEKTN